MSSTHIPVLSAGAERRGELWWQSTQIWGAVSIVSMWLATLFVGIYGKDIVSSSADSGVTVPSVAVVAICAVIGTVSIAHAVFGRGGERRDA